MRTTRDDGMTMVELLIVIALIGIIAAFAVPRLLRARASANEASAIASLRAVSTAQDLFARSCGSGGYTTSFVVLGTPPPGTSIAFLSADIASATTPQHAGYAFAMGPGAGAANGPVDCQGNATRSTFYAKAEPLTLGISGSRSFALTDDHAIWQLPGAVAPAEPFGAPATTVQ